MASYAKAGCVFLLLVGLSVYGQTSSVSSFIAATDRARLQSIFQGPHTYQTSANLFYSISGLKLLGLKLPNEKEACDKLTTLISGDLESIYFAAAASQALTNCKMTLSQAHTQVVSDAIKPESDVITIYHSTLASQYLGIKVDEKNVKTTLLEALKKDDSPLSYGYAFHVASKLEGDLTKFFDSIEDIVAQADEVDEKHLQFEGGLFITSVVMDGIYELAAAAKKMPTISDAKVIKFISYLLSRKNVHQLRSAYHLLSAITAIANNKFYTPVALTLVSPMSVTQKQPLVQVQVSDILGNSLGDVAVMADSARHLGDDAVIISKQDLVQSKTDRMLFELNLLNAKPTRGFYKIDLSVARPGTQLRLLGNTGVSVQVKVMSQVAVETAEIGVGDADQATALRTMKLEYPKKAATILEADYHQKVVFKFRVRDVGSEKLMTPHQTFVRLTNKQTNQEIIFVAEADSAMLITFDLDVAAKGKEFGHLSGTYSMDLIVGDAVIENPFSWLVCDLALSFREDLVQPKKERNTYSKRPEIKHMFREQEKRPPQAVSTAFTVLVVLPLVLLLGLWMKIGVNIRNFPMTVSAVAFHICLAVIFVLYILYWLQLNMFVTLRYLGIIAVPTFFFGNRLLSSLAAKTK